VFATLIITKVGTQGQRQLQRRYVVGRDMYTKDIVLNGIVVGQHESTGDLKKDFEAVDKFLKDNGLHKEPTLNESMMGQANGFASVANEIYAKYLKVSPLRGDMVSPFIVNAFFSVEIYFKTIHNAYGNTIRGHNLRTLYDGMPNRGKRHFENSANDVHKRYKHDKGCTIQSIIDDLSKAFEEWRYVYENNGLQIELQAVRYLMHSSFEACARVLEEIKS